MSINIIEKTVYEYEVAGEGAADARISVGDYDVVIHEVNLNLYEAPAKVVQALMAAGYVKIGVKGGEKSQDTASLFVHANRWKEVLDQ